VIATMVNLLETTLIRVGNRDYLRENKSHGLTTLSRFGAPGTGTDAKRNLKLAIEEVAGRLGNTVAICRKCYVHPHVVECYMNGRLLLERGAREVARCETGLLRAEERAVLALLRRTAAGLGEQQRRAG
jgi:DNA topoisomerase I